MNAKPIMGPLFFSALVLLFMVLIIGNVRSNPENSEWSQIVFFVS